VKEIYSEQENWLPLARANKDLEVVEEFRKIGKLAGLTDSDLDSCLADREMLKELIGWHKTNMETHEISGTPGIVIDGVVTSSTSFEAISKLLDEKLGS
jgi:protein-disulfide isomerase